MSFFRRFFGPEYLAPEPVVEEEFPEFRILTTVSLAGHGGFEVKSGVYRYNPNFKGSERYEFLTGFREECVQDRIESTKASVNEKADDYIAKLRAIPPEEVRYVE